MKWFKFFVQGVAYSWVSLFVLGSISMMSIPEGIQPPQALPPDIALRALFIGSMIMGLLHILIFHFGELISAIRQSQVSLTPK